MAAKVQPLFGEVLKTFGTEGELLVKLGDTPLKDENIKEPLFVIIDGLWVPFFIKRFELKGKRAIIIFENMESESLAEELIGKKIYSGILSDENNTTSELSVLAGFIVEDSEFGVLGKVTDVFDFPGNPCIEVETENGAIMIPLNGEVKIIYRKKIIKTHIPEGLLDIF